MTGDLPAEGPGSDVDLIPIARFLFLPGHFKKGIVRPGAFTPVVANGRRETSIYNTAGLEPEEVSETGKRVGELGNRPVLGRAELDGSVVVAEDLFMEFDDTPFRGHGNILGWPSGDDDDSISNGLEKRRALARASTLVVT